MPPIAHWIPLSWSFNYRRSSHCLSVTPNGRALLYGGEYKSRDPSDGPLAPDSRVGAASLVIGDYFYIWGGRESIDISLLSDHQAGIWRSPIAVGTENSPTVWERINAINEEDAPQSRSFHAMTSYGNIIYVHAGYLENCRTGQLHAFDLTTKTWTPLATAPDPGRGGTALVTVHLKGAPVLLRFAGFAGEELDSLDVYDIHTDTWRTIVPEHDPRHGSPGARSVYGFVPFVSPHFPRSLALVYHGKRTPSAQVRIGALEFWDDVWMLEAGGDGEPELAWKKVYVPGNKVAPAPCGWFPSASWVDGEETKVVLYGGMVSNNERCGMLWLLEVINVDVDDPAGDNDNPV
ncbi:hypothetical protein B0F90DRAFT_1810122 [Multifurca ochricompacta]|uniref:Kelch repeat-containing protein n=1 Tax=Multifurca ochricompacta TaxID=376703 RepID=A0AAD4QNX4_9AGAM|nr:hypothetical protein B0F90DRAFT_1810122 [Multifurca ochricompacta]